MIRHYISSLSGEYIKSQSLAHKVSYTTSQPLPDIELAENEYFTMLDTDGKVQYWPDDTGCTWQVKTRFEKVTTYHKQTQESTVFDDASLVTEEYTLEKPSTQWDEWIVDIWVTNESNKYIAEYDQVDSARRAAYREVSDPLYMEAWRKESKGLVDEAAVFRQQADAAVELIQAEHPWPTPPELSSEV